MSENHRIPRHVAIIMDGNGRWAKKRGLPRLLGHRAGVKTLEKMVYAAKDRGIKHLSVYAFSSENWKRPALEVKGLMKLFNYYAKKKLEELKKEDIRVRFAGNRSKLPEEVQKSMELAEKETLKCKTLDLVACFNYGGREELVKAINKIVASGEKTITEDTVRKNLYLPDLPDPDLIIRTSGELRLSNFWLWQSSYSEFYFTDMFWPDFDERALDDALMNYSERDRKYGGLK